MTDNAATAAPNDDKEDVFHWPPLESDPAIFTKYLHSIGLKDEWEIGECYGLDEDCLGFIPSTCVAMIVNAERLKKKDDGDDSNNADFYYMKQSKTLDNACGIIACLHALFNNTATLAAIQEGSVLSRFWEKVKDETPQERCTSLENFTDFQKAHKAYANQGQSALATTQADVNHHYTAFVLSDKKQLVELDGTKSGPLVLSENVETAVTHATAAELKKRLQEGSISESLSVMTLVKL